MALTVDYAAFLIRVTGQVDVQVQEVVDAARVAEATECGVTCWEIIAASGKESLGDSVEVGITAELQPPWQLWFEDGAYIARVLGGNLVGGIDGDPIAYSGQVQVLLIQSAASTIVHSGGSALTQAEHDALLAAQVDAETARKHVANRAVISADDREVTVYEDDGTTPLDVFDVSADKRERVPR